MNPGILHKALGGSKEKNAILFIKDEEIPADQKAMYGQTVVAFFPQKYYSYQTSLTVGVNLINHPGWLSTPTADMLNQKLLFNSTISITDALFVMADLKNFYLNTPMDRYTYMRLSIYIITQWIIEVYDLMSKVKNDFVMCEIHQGMYGFPQEEILANKLLKILITEDGCRPWTLTPGLWKHDDKPLNFLNGRCFWNKIRWGKPRR